MMSPVSFSLERIILFGHHVDQLKTFYVEHFQLRVVEEIEGQWVVLKAGHCELAIHRVGSGYEPADGQTFPAEGNAKLVFRMQGDLAKFRQQLLDRHVAVGEIKSFDGYHSLFCDGEDPEGNVFQIEQPL